MIRAGANAPGVLITFEGGDGAGKSTHIRLLGDVLDALGLDAVRVREPGGTAVGERLRSIVLDAGNAELCDRAELLIYEAARAQLVHEVVSPALARGSVVLCDRFTDSTVAYQGYGRHLPVAFVEACNAFAAAGVVPDATVVLSCSDASVKAGRVLGREGQDRLEQAGSAFHREVDAAFQKIAAASAERVRVVESCGGKRETALSVFDALAGVLPCLAGDRARAALDEALRADDACDADGDDAADDVAAPSGASVSAHASFRAGAPSCEDARG